MDVPLADLTMQERYKIIVGLIVPRPIAWISTVNAAGVNNCAPYSFFNALTTGTRTATPSAKSDDSNPAPMTAARTPPSVPSGRA